MNAPYWTVIPGQLQPGEIIDRGYSSARAAWSAQAKLGKGRIVCLRTMESEYSIEDVRYAPFETTRYCLVVQED